MNILKLLSLSFLFIGLFSTNITAQEGNASSEKYMNANDLSGESAQIVNEEDVFIPSTMPPRFDKSLLEAKPNTKLLEPSASYKDMVKSCKTTQQNFIQKYPQYENVVAIADVELSKGNIDIGDKISLAFRQALAKASLSLLSTPAQVNNDFSRHAIEAYKQGYNSVDLYELQESMEQSINNETLFGKAKLFLHAKIDSALKNAGISPGSQELDQVRMQQAIDSIQTQVDYRSVTNSLINDAVTSGTRLIKSRISDSGACVVVVRDSNTQFFAQLISDDVNLFMPQFATNWTLANWIPNPDTPGGLAELMGRMGAYSFVDSDGQLQLVSFGMSRVNGQNNPDTRSMAKTRAERRATDYMCAYLSSVNNSKFNMDDSIKSSTFKDESRDQNVTALLTQKELESTNCTALLRTRYVDEWSTNQHPYMSGQVYGTVIRYEFLDRTL